MLEKRLIPNLLLKGSGFYKTLKFKNPQYVGDPINTIKIFNEKEVDEILITDITASKDKKKPNFDLLAHLASEAFIPLSYGGGLYTLEDIQKVLQIGFEKVALCSALFSDLELVTKASRACGSQSVIGVVNLKKNFWGKYQVYDHVIQKGLSLDPLEHISSLVKAGVGEVLINFVDRDGTRSGMDVKGIKLFTDDIEVPVIASGGAKDLLDIKEALDLGLSGVSAGALFVYYGPHKAVLINYPNRSDIETTLGSSLHGLSNM